jgi:hypothetical protein
MARFVTRGRRGVHALFDAGVNALVEDDRIVAIGQGGEQRKIGEEAAAEIERLFNAEELSREFLKSRMGRMVTAQQPRTSGADDAVLLQRFDGGIAQRGMRAQAEIIVGREIDSGGKHEHAVPLETPQRFRLDCRALHEPGSIYFLGRPDPGPYSTLWLMRTGCGKSAIRSRISSGMSVLTFKPSAFASLTVIG